MSLSEQGVRSSRTLRLHYIDQLRALAALYVAFFHTLLVLWPEPGPLPPLYLRWAFYGHFGVTVFIVLSGFSLALKPALRGEARVRFYWRFMYKRALRMLPPYWLALFGSIVLLALAPGNVAGGSSGGGGAEWTGKGAVPARSIAAFFFLVHDIVKVPSPNSPLWSIAVEWHLYFFFPLLVFVGCRYGMPMMVAGCVAVGVVLHFALLHTSAIWTAPHFLVLFGLGIATSYGVARALAGPEPPWIARWSISGWWFVAAAFVVFVVVDWPTTSTTVAQALARKDRVSNIELVADLAAGAVFAAGIYLLGVRHPKTEVEGHPEGNLVSRFLSRVGLISYSLYLVHSPAEKIVWHFVVKPLDLPATLGYVVLVVSGVGASLAAAYLLYLIIERRSMAWSRRVSVG